MKVKALTKFNYGGIVKMKKGEVKEVDDKHAAKLIEMGAVQKVVISHKNIEEK